jgi:hypothetical protein
MLLRHHPLFSYHGMLTWPPVWTWTDGAENKRPRGEVGILKAVGLSDVQPADRCFLSIEHKGSRYIGCLLIDDGGFCHQIVKLLQAHCNHSIAEIGGIDVSYPLAAWIENKICPVMIGWRRCGLQTFWRGVFDEFLEPSFDVYVCAKGHETYFLSSEK